QAEADRRALEKADSLVELTIQLWKFHAKKLDEPTLKLEDFAQQAELSAPVLSALEKYLKARTLDKGHYLQPWNELLPKPDGSREPSDALRKYAEQFRDKVKENLQRVLKKRNLDQQKDLFGEKGVFPLVEATILPDANSAWKAHYEALQQTVRELKAKLPPEPARCVACEDHDPHDIQVQLRGNPYKKGAKVPRRFLRVLAGDEPPPFTSGSGRQELAEAIASPTNPLTARVIVNRIWQQDLGQGLVSTPSNFGAQGMPPTHPALLDYLAAQFVREGWSIKRLHRAILHSEAYQRSSAPVAENLQVDPENRWLWRMAPHRLTVEEFRDSILSAAGTLDLHGGGPSDDLDAAKTTRRTIYGKVSRKDLSKLLALWDFADPRISIDRRGESTMPQQMLFLMNSPFMIDNARRVAARLNDLKEPAAQIRRAFELTLVREPTAAELNLVGKFLAAEDPASGAQQKNELTRVERFVHSLLASNEFFFVN
ncbi:MAG TPA: DUF1553 domain-containing protein, partial [Pirellulales bacterium]|nr:DUF1553 domain-containing protein [Pirellulales bacterium]